MMTQFGYSDFATNFWGSNNTSRRQAGTTTGRAISSATATCCLSAARQQPELWPQRVRQRQSPVQWTRQPQLAVNGGGGGNTIQAGGPGDLNAGFNFFGQANNVAAGPGPLALAGSVLKDNQVVTKTNAGIAINNFRIGGTAVQGGQSRTASTATWCPRARQAIRRRRSRQPQPPRVARRRQAMRRSTQPELPWEARRSQAMRRTRGRSQHE